MTLIVTTPTKTPTVQEYGDAISRCMHRFGAGGLNRYGVDAFRAECERPEDERPPWPLPSTEMLWIPKDVGKFAMVAAETATSLDDLFRLLRIVQLHNLLKHTTKTKGWEAMPKIIVRNPEPLTITPETKTYARRLVVDGWRLSECATSLVKDGEACAIRPTSEELFAFLEASKEPRSQPFVATTEEYHTNMLLRAYHDRGMTERDVITALVEQLGYAHEQARA